MRRLLPFLSLFLLGAFCQSGKVTVTVDAGSWDDMEHRNVVYGVDTVRVACRPFRDVSYVELAIDGAVVMSDTFPGPESDFEWDARRLPDGSVHILRARAVSGSHEYLSPEDSVWVGFRSRLIADRSDNYFTIFRPNGVPEVTFLPIAEGVPSYPRLAAGSHSAVFVANRVLCEKSLDYNLSADTFAQVANGIYSCDASPVSEVVAFEGYPAANAHLFTKDSANPMVQITHDSDFVIIDSSRFTCIANSSPAFSPGGNRLAYFRRSRCLVPGDPHENETREDAFVMNSNGTNPVNLTAGVADAYFSGFTWTFDGKWVLFRAGTGSAPDDVLAANLSGRVITGLAIPAAAMACSPTDSTLAYVSSGSEQQLYTLKLAWTSDTLYVGKAGVLLAQNSYLPGNRSLDWAKYSGE